MDIEDEECQMPPIFVIRGEINEIKKRLDKYDEMHRRIIKLIDKVFQVLEEEEE